MGTLYDNSLTAFIIITLVLAGGASWMSGRALAQTWQPSWLAVAYAILLALPARFLHWSLANGTLLSAHYLLTDAILLILIGAKGRVRTRGFIDDKYLFCFLF